jgi:hypothetical protein
MHETVAEYEFTSPEYTNPNPKEETWTFMDET